MFAFDPLEFFDYIKIRLKTTCFNPPIAMHCLDLAIKSNWIYSKHVIILWTDGKEGSEESYNPGYLDPLQYRA